jgi:hypothetical protein
MMKEFVGAYIFAEDLLVAEVLALQARSEGIRHPNRITRSEERKGKAHTPPKTSFQSIDKNRSAEGGNRTHTCMDNQTAQRCWG